MPIYEQPTRVLMREFAQAELQPGQIFARRLAVDWFAKHYPNIKPNTVQMHVEGMSTNSTLRAHHPSIRPASGHDLFFKVARGQYRLWDASHDPQPVYAETLLNHQLQVASQLQEQDEEEEDSDAALSNEFGAERDLQNYLAKNLPALEPGLVLYDDEGLRGVEFPAGGRRIDILAKGSDGGFVVIELKVSRGYDRVIGQIMRYMAWVKLNLADGRPVRGIIVASAITEDLKLAASLIEGVHLVEYELSFKLKSV